MIPKMPRLTALILIVIIIAVQLSTTECKKKDKYKKGKKNKGCKFNMKTYKTDETILTDSAQCVSLVCRELKKKPKGRKKGGKGKKKSAIVPEAISDCFPTQCMDMPCSGGRCLPPTKGPSAECEEQNPTCPTEWECTVEKFTDSDTGCTKCRCKLDDPQYESKCGPSDPPCPMDCGVMTIVNEETGCTECICDPEDTDNPFETPSNIPTKEGDGSSSVVSWKDGCNNCTCMDGMPVCTLKGCLHDNDDLPICKNGCSKEMVEVCGTDDITYDNSCLLDFARLCRGRDVQFNHSGPCECKPCNKRKYDPVCGDDCKTYSNACVLDFENCVHKKDVRQVKRGSCDGEKDINKRHKREIPRRIGQKVPLFGNKREIPRRTWKKVSLLGNKEKIPKRTEEKKTLFGNKEEIHRTGKKVQLSDNKRKNQMMQFKKKKKGKKCEYNGKKIKANSEVDLGINCSQLKCIKTRKKPALEMQYKNGCECDMA